MSSLHFNKYQGAGNDFVLIDGRSTLPFSDGDHRLIQRICHRQLGIGADGLMLLRDHPDYDFEMLYFNADGRPSSMCGNGGRCIVAFAQKLGMITQDCQFLASDGPHTASIGLNGEVSLSMIAVRDIERADNDFVLDTGSPHYVRFERQIDDLPLVDIAHSIRYGDRFRQKGINVNLVEEQSDEVLHIRTYERGVEGETLACGTGVTAAAITQAVRKGVQAGTEFGYTVQTRGGTLNVSGKRTANGFEQLSLKGPATFVFEGEYPLPANQE